VKEGENMAHEHIVNDSDKHFSINPLTREITNESGKVVLIQHDHNSEQFTFSVPKEVDGHDMTLCNRVKIHYLNVELTEDLTEDGKVKKDNEGKIIFVPTGTVYKGIYETDDVEVDAEDENKVVCSWLISRNATQYAGELNFSVRYSCVDDNGEEVYGWSTEDFVGIMVGEGIFNNDVIVEDYPDILEKWRQELVLANITKQYTPEEARAELGAVARFAVTTTLGTAWSNSAPYTQTLTFSGAKATDTPHISPVYSDNLATSIAEKEAWAMVSKAEAAENSIVFTCFEEKPDVQIPIQIEVFR
jgi:hypothetical protein